MDPDRDPYAAPLDQLRPEVRRLSWAPPTGTAEALLLERYWQLRGGRLYAEVDLSGAFGAPKDGTRVRWVDGLIILGHPDGGADNWHRGHKNGIRDQLLADLAAGYEVELVEVKPKEANCCLGGQLSAADYEWPGFLARHGLAPRRPQLTAVSDTIHRNIAGWLADRIGAAYWTGGGR